MHFPKNYSAARHRFLDACSIAGAVVEHHKCPKNSPEGQPLWTDVVWFGPQNAERVLVAISGTHGAEGLVGSACQTAAILSGVCGNLPPKVTVVFIHLINPYGVAWLQQETEEGVNLNRNYVDHAGVYPPSPLYAQIHDALSCPDLEGTRYEAAEAVIAEFRARNELAKYQQAIFGGQYHWPRGLNYGGNHAVWANLTLKDILVRHLRGARHVAVLDYHSGLGPYCHLYLTASTEKGSELFTRASTWYGDSVILVPGAETEGGVRGTTADGCIQALPQATVTPITVEFGTFDIETEIRVVRRDFWLRTHGDRKSDIGQRIKSELLGYFCPDAADWTYMVSSQSEQVIKNALIALASEA